MISEKRRWLIHVVGWLLFYSLIYAFIRSMGMGERTIQAYPFLQFVVFYAILFYGNLEILLPKFYLQKKYTLYFTVILLLLLLAFYLQPFEQLVHQPFRESNPFPQPPPEFRMPDEGLPPRHERVKLDIVSIVLFLMIWSFSSALQIIKQWRLTQQIAIQAEADKAQAELSFLKAQINPHFLFNTLNTIYSMAVTKSDHTAVAVMKLSNLLRYVTDDVQENFVSLQTEADCIQDYIDLQSMRLSTKANVVFKKEGDFQAHQIPPLLLMTFVENAFKYGISNHHPSDITIHLSARPDAIYFSVRNLNFDSASKLERKGIGIANTKERLRYLYPDCHQLVISTENNFYTVTLILQNKCN